MQTKLSRDEKQQARMCVTIFELDNKGEIFHFPHERMTIAICPVFPGSRMALIGIANMAPTETKYRKLVGAYSAINNAYVGAFQLPLQPIKFADWASEFAWMQGFFNPENQG